MYVWNVSSVFFGTEKQTIIILKLSRDEGKGKKFLFSLLPFPLNCSVITTEEGARRNGMVVAKVKFG